MFLLIDNYDSFTYNLYALFKSIGENVDVIKNSEYREAERYCGIILSPGPSRPESSGTSLEYLSRYRGKKPIFGVCLGMQAIAYSMGYPVVHASTVKHGKVDTIVCDGESLLFKNMPERFQAVRYHSLAVDGVNGLSTSHAESDNTVMSIEDSSQMIFGVQFHPESILSEHGKTIVSNFRDFAKGEHHG